ncbi:MAG TPA: efflux RND transporter periplasmic adaptor subunit [Bryobacteraceae bacterium]|nr:efflux RND transporter periplasmic adaptor subunit [Bryobacteraceae bacterium]
MRSNPGVFSCFGLIAAAVMLTSCSGARNVQAKDPGGESAVAGVSVGVVKVIRKNVGRTLTVSSELVPFQEIDVYAKESGFVKELNVDYGSRVQKDQVLATLEIPELQLQVKEDDAAVKNAEAQIPHAQDELNRMEAQQKVLQLQFDRLNGVSQAKPGLVAQQEVDDSQGKALASAAQVEAAKSNLQSAESELAAKQAKREHDQALFDYAKITAPFAGVVTQRYANLGTLMQGGTNSSTQAMPLVKLSQDDLFRLVIPVPESYVKFIHLGDAVSVNVPSLNRTFPGKVARFSVDVREDTRTMHTEVDVSNPGRVLLPGLYAEATISLEKKDDAIAVPLQAVDQDNNRTTVDVVDSSGKIDRRQIVLGIQTPTDAEVLSGLQEGEIVVVSDRSGLKAGQEVHPQMIQLIQYQSSEER